MAYANFAASPRPYPSSLKSMKISSLVLGYLESINFVNISDLSLKVAFDKAKNSTISLKLTTSFGCTSISNKLFIASSKRYFVKLSTLISLCKFFPKNSSKE